QDVSHLLNVLQRLADAGNTVLVIEHHLDVIKSADWLIDLGPLGGDRGGELIATGTPEEVAQDPASYTGQYLRPILEAAGTIPRAEPAPVLKPMAARRNGKAARSPELTLPDAAADRAAASIGARIGRESTPQGPRPQTKAAAKRERQAAHPRKETASERGLREKREAQPRE
ncbi:MAG TPA: hypothetical protein VN697_07935, partial [Tepidiformaceae bacterium]|nr:hypothetical protein [Tepidiformaceae bacterium]